MEIQFKHLFVITCLVVGAYFLHIVFPKKKKKTVNSTAALMIDVYDIIDALESVDNITDRAAKLNKLIYADALADSLIRNHKNVIGVKDDVEEYKKQISQKRNSILAEGVKQQVL